MNHRVNFARYPRVYERLSGLYRPEYDPEGPVTRVILLIGRTRCGKTLSVYKELANNPEFYETPLTSSGLWRDGYDRHKFVLMDDFSGANSQTSLPILLKLLDTYPRQVATKGGFTWYNPTTVVVTSNVHPWRWYDFLGREEEYDALAARFAKVCVWIHEDKQPTLANESFWLRGKALKTYWDVKRGTVSVLERWMDVVYPKEKKLSTKNGKLYAGSYFNDEGYAKKAKLIEKIKNVVLQS